MSLPFHISSLKEEGMLQVSKWQKIQVILDPEEMKDLLSALGNIHFVCVSQPVIAEKAVISAASFYEKYVDYIRRLREGEIADAAELRKWFSCAMTTDLKTFYALAVGGDKYLIKPIKPIVQLQSHSFFYSDLDRKFHPMVLSGDSISWGLQFSYPQLFQDPKTHQVVKVTDTQEFPNSALFSKLSKWMRSSTLPTPFMVSGKRTNSPIRVGKKALAWIKDHPQLKKRGITVYEY
jgi:hypothetical protein